MPLDEVANAIMESAQQEASKRIKLAEKEREKMLHEVDLRIHDMQQVEEKELQQTLLRMRRQELSGAEIEAQKVVLNEKREILTRTFNEMIKEMSKLKPTEKSILYKEILANGKKAIPHPRVFIPKREANLLTGVEGYESLKETDMEPGLILENSDGTTRLDLRFRTILENVWERELKNVVNILFE